MQKMVQIGLLILMFGCYANVFAADEPVVGCPAISATSGGGVFGECPRPLK